MLAFNSGLQANLPLLSQVVCSILEYTPFQANKIIGISFQTEDAELSTPSEILSSEQPIAIAIDGKAVREIPGPKGLPFVGNFFEVYPDHLGNHQRLFDQYGPIFQTTNMGRTIYQTNDPQLAQIVFSESDFFTKKINESHPLYPIKNQDAGVFLGDTDTRNGVPLISSFPRLLVPRPSVTMRRLCNRRLKMLSRCLITLTSKGKHGTFTSTC